MWHLVLYFYNIMVCLSYGVWKKDSIAFYRRQNWISAFLFCFLSLPYKISTSLFRFRGTGFYYAIILDLHSANPFSSAFFRFCLWTNKLKAEASPCNSQLVHSLVCFRESSQKSLSVAELQTGIFVCALGMCYNLAVKVRYMLGSRNC